jgi:hypothetical protein
MSEAMIGGALKRDSSARIAAICLVAYAVFLYLAQTRAVAVFDDEAVIVSMAAAQAPAETLRVFLAERRGQHEHPPLYDLLLHFWMRATDDSRPLLRVPSILFWCLGLGLIGATAQRLFGKRLLAVGIGMAWPIGLFLGTPAHWSALGMLGVAGSTWAYFRWRERGDAASAGLFAVLSVLLFWTNYLGLAFVGVLGLHFLSSRPNARAWRQGVGAAAGILLGIAPLLPAFLRQLAHGTEVDRSLITVGADVAFHSFALLASESVAPWSPAAVPMVLGMAYLGARTAANAQRLWPMAGLALVLISSGVLGVLNAKRLGLFGPWLLLSVTCLVHVDPRPRRILTALALVFGMGWIGIVHGGWWSSYRYVEPWDQVLEEALRWSEPGGVVICDHPSFYFEAHYALGWQRWIELKPEEPIRESGRRFSALSSWREAVAGTDRVVYVRTTVHSKLVLEERTALESELEGHFHLVRRGTWLEDPAAELKRRFVPGAPRFRIEVLLYERARPSG